MDPLAYVYSAANALRRNVKDLVANPGAYLERQADATNNTYAGKVPVANEQEGMGMRQLSDEERTKAMAEGSLDTVGGALGVIKPKGGNWVGKQLEREVAALRNTPEYRTPIQEGTPEHLANQWVDKSMMNYVKNLMGTEEDPIRKLADQGISHVELGGYRLPGLERPLSVSRKEAGYPPRGVSKTPMGKEWEKRADSPIAFADAKASYQKLLDNKGDFNFTGSFGDTAHPMANSMAEEIPALGKDASSKLERAKEKFGWIDKVPEGTKMYGFDRGTSVPLLHFGQLDKLVQVTTDALRSGQLTPQQINSGSHSIENAVRMADVVRKTKLEAANFPDVHMDLPDLEQKIVRLNKPGQFAKESDQMGHSVRGYEPDEKIDAAYGHGGWKGIESGGAEVYSVRDKAGKPMATVEVKVNPDGSKEVTQIKGKSNRGVDPKASSALEKFLNDGNFSKVDLDKSGLVARDGKFVRE